MGKLARFIINLKQKLGLGLLEKLANELHKPIIRNFKRRKVNFGNFPNEIWSADLIDLKKLKKKIMDFNALLILLIYFQDMLGVYQLKIKLVKV